MKAAVVQADHTAKVDEKPIPKIKPNEILLKTKTVGINPTDWKQSGMAQPGVIIGCDFVGEVVEIGSEVPISEVKAGDLRWAFVKGSTSPERGAFAEYVAAEWDLTSVVPSNVTPEQAASLPIPILTAIQTLYLRLGVPEYPQTFKDQPWILIWSGATAVGQYTIQLAKLSGMRVAVTASEKRWPRLKEFGADLLIDYKDPDVVKKLKEGTNDSIKYGLDCVFEGGSSEKIQLAMSPSGGHLVQLWMYEGDLPRKDVKTEVTLAYTLLGEDMKFSEEIEFKSSPQDRPLYVKWAKIVTELLREGKIKPLDVEVIGDLNDIKKALEILKNRQNQHKLVLTVA